MDELAIFIALIDVLLDSPEFINARLAHLNAGSDVLEYVPEFHSINEFEWSDN